MIDNVRCYEVKTVSSWEIILPSRCYLARLIYFILIACISFKSGKTWPTIKTKFSKLLLQKFHGSSLLLFPEPSNFQTQEQRRNSYPQIPISLVLTNVWEQRFKKSPTLSWRALNLPENDEFERLRYTEFSSVTDWRLSTITLVAGEGKKTRRRRVGAAGSPVPSPPRRFYVRTARSIGDSWNMRKIFVAVLCSFFSSLCGQCKLCPTRGSRIRKGEGGEV